MFVNAQNVALHLLRLPAASSIKQIYILTYFSPSVAADTRPSFLDFSDSTSGSTFGSIGRLSQRDCKEFDFWKMLRLFVKTLILDKKAVL